MNATKTARALGVLSIGLGAAALLAPRTITRALGTKDRSGLVRSLLGAREIAQGVGILAAKRSPAPFLWSRVLGDAVDLAALGAALKGNPKKVNVGLAMAAVAGVAALDLFAARRLTPG